MDKYKVLGRFDNGDDYVSVLRISCRTQTQLKVMISKSGRFVSERIFNQPFVGYRKIVVHFECRNYY